MLQPRWEPCPEPWGERGRQRDDVGWAGGERAQGWNRVGLGEEKERAKTGGLNGPKGSTVGEGAEPGDKVTAVLPALGAINRDNWERNAALSFFVPAGAMGASERVCEGPGKELMESAAGDGRAADRGPGL